MPVRNYNALDSTTTSTVCWTYCKQWKQQEPHRSGTTPSRHPVAASGELPVVIVANSNDPIAPRWTGRTTSSQV